MKINYNDFLNEGSDNQDESELNDELLTESAVEKIGAGIIVGLLVAVVISALVMLNKPLSKLFIGSGVVDEKLSKKLALYTKDKSINVKVLDTDITDLVSTFGGGSSSNELFVSRFIVKALTEKELLSLLLYNYKFMKSGNSGVYITIGAFSVITGALIGMLVAKHDESPSIGDALMADVIVAAVEFTSLMSLFLILKKRMKDADEYVKSFGMAQDLGKAILKQRYYVIQRVCGGMSGICSKFFRLGEILGNDPERRVARATQILKELPPDKARKLETEYNKIKNGTDSSLMFSNPIRFLVSSSKTIATIFKDK